MSLLLQLRNREDFEARTLRALAGGALAGLVVALAERKGQHVDATTLALVGTVALASFHKQWQRWAGAGLGALAAMTVPALLGLPDLLERACMGGAAAAVLGWLGLPSRPKPAQVVAGALGAAGLVPLGLYVQQVLHERLFSGQLEALSAVVGGATLGLFWSVGTLLSHVEVHLDAVQAQGTALQARLAGEPQELVERALRLYRQSREAAGRLGAGKGALTSALERMTLEVFSLAESLAGLEAQLAAVVRGDVDAQVKGLRERAAATGDAVARRQFELAASSLGEELNRLDALGRRQERLMAQLHAQVALLERARVSLVGAQGAEAKDREAQMTQLAQRLKALAEEGTGTGTGTGDAAAQPSSEPAQLAGGAGKEPG